MSRKRKMMQICARLLAGLMGLFLLLMLALPIGAASEKVEDVLAVLNQLQGSHIQYEWLPDIEANQALVQELLTRYQGLDGAERAELTAEQNTHLRGYFEALYQVQGRPAAEVDALFEAAPAASSEVESVSQAPESVASQPEEDRSIAPPPQSAAQDNSLPVFQNPPQAPRGDGWFGFFANQGLGTALLAVLVVLALVLFIRFVVALRKAPRPTADDTDAEARAAELFGENYADSELIDMDALERAGRQEKELKAAAEAAGRLAEENAEGLEFEDLEDMEALADDSQPEEAVRRKGFFGRLKRKAADAEAPAAPGDAEDEAGGEEAGPSLWNSKAVSTMDARPRVMGTAKPEKPAEGTFATNVPALKRTVSLPDPQPDEPVKKAVETIGKNPDKTDSIVMRGFTPKPPDGRPGKMPFRQGDPNDPGGIDD